jgi:hypothetical protein
MSVGKFFKVGVFDTSTPLGTGATVTSTTPTPILYGVTVSGQDCNISAIRVGCFGSGSGFPSNASFTASLNIVTGTVGGGNTATARQLNAPATLSAQTTFLTAGGTSAAAITTLTLSMFLWSQQIPFTAGANWGEWFTPNYEINIPVSTKFALYITEFSAGTGTTFGAEIEFGE